MDYEKKYKEAIERAKIWQEHLYDVNDKDYADELNYIFPELAESEDEKIRKGLIEEMRRFQREAARQSCDADFEFAKSAIAWLEKKGEKEKFIKKELGCIQGYREEAIRRLHKLEKQEWSEKYIAEVFEKVGLAKIAREQGYDALTKAIQSAMIELSKFTSQPRLEWSEKDEQNFIESVEALEDFGKFELADWLKERKLLFLYGISIKLEGNVIKKIEK